MKPVGVAHFSIFGTIGLLLLGTLPQSSFADPENTPPVVIQNFPEKGFVPKKDECLEALRGNLEAEVQDARAVAKRFYDEYQPRDNSFTWKNIKRWPLLAFRGTVGWVVHTVNRKLREENDFRFPARYMVSLKEDEKKQPPVVGAANAFAYDKPESGDFEPLDPIIIGQLVTKYKIYGPVPFNPFPDLNLDSNYLFDRDGEMYSAESLDFGVWGAGGFGDLLGDDFSFRSEERQARATRKAAEEKKSVRKKRERKLKVEEVAPKKDDEKDKDKDEEEIEIIKVPWEEASEILDNLLNSYEKYPEDLEALWRTVITQRLQIAKLDWMIQNQENEDLQSIVLPVYQGNLDESGSINYQGEIEFAKTESDLKVEKSNLEKQNARIRGRFFRFFENYRRWMSVFGFRTGVLRGRMMLQADHKFRLEIFRDRLLRQLSLAYHNRGIFTDEHRVALDRVLLALQNPKLDPREDIEGLQEWKQLRKEAGYFLSKLIKGKDYRTVMALYNDVPTQERIRRGILNLSGIKTRFETFAKMAGWVVVISGASALSYNFFQKIFVHPRLEIQTVAYATENEYQGLFHALFAKKFPDEYRKKLDDPTRVLFADDPRGKDQYEKLFNKVTEMRAEHFKNQIGEKRLNDDIDHKGVIHLQENMRRYYLEASDLPHFLQRMSWYLTDVYGKDAAFPKDKISDELMGMFQAYDSDPKAAVSGEWRELAVENYILWKQVNDRVAKNHLSREQVVEDFILERILQRVGAELTITINNGQPPTMAPKLMFAPGTQK